MTLRTAALAGIAIALIVAACGGGAGDDEDDAPTRTETLTPPSADKYYSDLETLILQAVPDLSDPRYASIFSEIQSGGTYDSARGGYARLLEELGDVLLGTVVQMEVLVPPVEAVAAHDQCIEAFNRVADALYEQRDLIEATDDTALEDAINTATELLSASSILNTLEPCDQILS